VAREPCAGPWTPAVLPDIFVCASLLLHIDHLHFVGLRTYHDMTYIKPCANYSELHCIQEDSSFDDMKVRPRPSMSRGAHQSAPLPLWRLYQMEDTEDVLGEN